MPMGTYPYPTRPTPASIERKLAAILSADVQGFSRLMEAREETTLHPLIAYQDFSQVWGAVRVRRYLGRKYR